MIEVREIKVPCGSGRAEIERKIGRMLLLAADEHFEWKILRHSVDARKKTELTEIFSAAVSLPGGTAREEKLLRRLKDRRFVRYAPCQYSFPSPSVKAAPLKHRPVIIGFGPAGIFCALELARHGLRPIVLERGRDMERRSRDAAQFWETGRLDPVSNIQFGEGGAGTFSDGKLTTNVKDKNGRNMYVLRSFIAAGAPENIAYEYHPHIGTDRLREVIVNLRKEIISLGGEVRFENELVGLMRSGGQLTGLCVRRPDGSRELLQTEIAVLAIGHSARNTVRMLHLENVPMQAKSFAVGFRVSHPQTLIDSRQYGVSDREEMERLGLEAASYKLTARASDGKGVYSFCMCPGGYIVNASSEEGRLAVNGMSDFARDSARANSAIIITVGPEDFGSEGELAGMLFQEKLEERAYRMAGGRIPVEKYEDFADGFLRRRGRAGGQEVNCPREKPEAPPASGKGGKDLKAAADLFIPLSEEETERLCLKGQAAFAPLHSLLPETLTADFIEGMEQFERTIPGYTGAEAYVCGLESRTSSPVRILRNEKLESELRGLYPCGEGAGYAGGIMSAAIDGLKIAEAIACDHLPPV